jgi:hypothetical protein
MTRSRAIRDRNFCHKRKRMFPVSGGVWPRWVLAPWRDRRAMPCHRTRASRHAVDCASGNRGISRGEVCDTLTRSARGQWCSAVGCESRYGWNRPLVRPLHLCRAPRTVIVSDDAGQFDVGAHGLLTPPPPASQTALQTRSDGILTQRTGYVTLDRLLKRLHANKPELLMALERPEIPLHTNGSENDIRCHVTRRKVSGGARSDRGRECRDTFLGLAKDLRQTCNFILGLSGRPTGRPRRQSCSPAAGTCPCHSPGTLSATPLPSRSLVHWRLPWRGAPSLFLGAVRSFNPCG